MVATKKKTPLRSTPSRKETLDLDAFAAAAGKSRSASGIVYPWQESHVREDVKKNLLVRIPEPLYMKLKYIAEKTPYSMNSFILEKLTGEIEEEIDRLNV